MKNSSHVMKDLKVTNKLRISGFSIFEKIKVLNFGGLGRFFNSSLATEKLCFDS